MHTILMGALLAILLAVWTPSARARRWLMISGTVAFFVMLYAWNVATGTSRNYYYGGSVLYAALACVVIAGALQPGALRSLLAIAPLAWIGRLSYGLYLFHWPIIVWLVPSRVHLDGFQLNVLRLVLTFAAATVTFYLIELPIRERRLPSLPWKRVEPFDKKSATPRRNVARWLALPLVAITIAVVVASTTGASPPPSYLTGVAPKKTQFPWNYGDPYYCTEPRPDEMQEASTQAEAAGPPPRRAIGRQRSHPADR